MEENKALADRQPEERFGQEQGLSAQQERQENAVLRDDQGRRVVDDKGEPIHWATKGERLIAFALALVVIAITIAFAYSLSTGDLIRR